MDAFSIKYLLDDSSRPHSPRARQSVRIKRSGAHNEEEQERASDPNEKDGAGFEHLKPDGQANDHGENGQQTDACNDDVEGLKLARNSSPCDKRPHDHRDDELPSGHERIGSPIKSQNE